MSLQDEVIQVYNDTNFHPNSGGCPIVFLTFLLANYTPSYIKKHFPRLYEQYKLAIDEDD